MLGLQTFGDFFIWLIEIRSEDDDYHNPSFNYYFHIRYLKFSSLLGQIWGQKRSDFEQSIQTSNSQ